MKIFSHKTPSMLIWGLLLCVAPRSVLFGQEKANEAASVPPTQLQTVFADVQRGLSSGDIGLIARHFASRVSVSLRGDESGTFSSNQTYYVLGDYLKSRQFAPFEFSSVGDSDANPFATGEAIFTLNGSKEHVQVYVALSHADEKYLITRLTIY